LSQSEAWLADCLPNPPQRLDGTLRRLVESQERVATTHLVDDLGEQSLLETLLETTKPPPPAGSSGLHYLLATPFRYPPLHHGSRFGQRFEPGLLYGARETRTVLAEAAYYRLLFFDGMRQAPPGGRLLTRHTLFGAAIASERGACLNRPPCDQHRKALCHPADYRASQALGSALRKAGIEIIAYCSARDPAHGENLALFTPRALSAPAPLFQQSWQCETRAGSVGFSGQEGFLRFTRKQFLHQGQLPRPAV